jgi:hypothetical protein
MDNGRLDYAWVRFAAEDLHGPSSIWKWLRLNHIRDPLIGTALPVWRHETNHPGHGVKTEHIVASAD